MRDDEWEFANPYVTRHLATHAAAAGTLEDLIADAGFLPYADPERLARVLTAVNYRIRPLARLYWRSLDQLRAAATPEERTPSSTRSRRATSRTRWRCCARKACCLGAPCGAPVGTAHFTRRLAGDTVGAWSVALGQGGWRGCAGQRVGGRHCALVGRR